MSTFMGAVQNGVFFRSGIFLRSGNSYVPKKCKHLVSVLHYLLKSGLFRFSPSALKDKVPNKGVMQSLLAHFAQNLHKSQDVFVSLTKDYGMKVNVAETTKKSSSSFVEDSQFPDKPADDENMS